MNHIKVSVQPSGFGNQVQIFPILSELCLADLKPVEQTGQSIFQDDDLRTETKLESNGVGQ